MECCILGKGRIDARHSTVAFWITTDLILVYVSVSKKFHKDAIQQVFYRHIMFEPDRPRHPRVKKELHALVSTS